MLMAANELPEELVTQILLRLPVAPLLRFKGVCKFWYALITHQNFVRKHLLHNNKNKNTFFLPNSTADNFVSMFCCETLQISLTQPLPPPYFGIDKKVKIYVVGACNGLVCLYDFYASRVVIWNPATRETKLVPKSNLLHIAPARIEGMGFGFDAKTNDYKIIYLLNLLTISHFKSFRSKHIVQSEVYSFSADSWRKVDSPPFNIKEQHYGPSTYINGMASWWAYAVGWVGILSFDMSNEVFLKTSMPDNVWNDNGHFFAFNESIAMAIISTEDEDIFDIWLLLEVGVKDSWTKLFTIGPFTKNLKPLRFWKKNIVLLEHLVRLFLYDPSTKEMTNLQIDRNWSHWVTYMETLVFV